MQITKHTFDVSDDLSFDVRSILRDGDPWFVAKDVATALGYENSRDAIGKHVEEEDKLTVAKRDAQILTGSSMARSTVIVNESGLYSLILGSHLDRAKVFKRWVTKVVLPSIRKHGAYVMGQEALPDALQADVAAASLKAMHLMKVRIDTVCGAKKYSKDDQAKIAVAYRAAEAIMQARGLDAFPYDSFAEQLVLLKVPHLKSFENNAMAKVNEAFKIDQYRKLLVKKHQSAFSSW